jgi:hypothetical protein
MSLIPLDADQQAANALWEIQESVERVEALLERIAVALEKVTP